MSIRTQYIYHPENDAFIARKILGVTNFPQHIDISKLTIRGLNRPDSDYWKKMEPVDVIILLVGSTFNRVTPFIYLHENFLRSKKGILGINISPIPDEWGQARKKSKIWLDGMDYSIKRSHRDIIKIHDIPANSEPYEYISRNFSSWVNQAYAHAQSGYA